MNEVKIPDEIYELTAVFEGVEYKIILKSGQTATPIYDPETKTISWDIKEETDD